MVKSVWVPPKRIYRHLHFTEKFSIKVDSENKFEIHSDGASIANEVFWEGLYKSWEGKSIEIWREACKYSKVMIDVGANAGFYTLVGKAVNPSMEIHAFEPSTDWFNRFNRNCEINNFDVNSYKLALSNVDDITYIKSVWREDDKNIKAVKLDSFLQKSDISRIDLIKIDVDHYVVEMIEGFKDTFEKYLPNLLIEIHEDEYALKVEEILQTKKHGYLYFNIDDNNFSLRQMDSLEVRSDDMNYFICHQDMAIKLNLIP